MKKEKLHIVSMFHLNANIVGKDMFLAPMYIGLYLGASVELVYPKADFNKEFAGEYRGVKLTPIKSNSQYHCTFRSEKEMGGWLVKNARRIDVLSLFWLNKRNCIFARVYKLLNPKGVVYIKGDINENSILRLNQPRGLKQTIKNWLYKSIDVFSVETIAAYEHIKAGAMGPHMSMVVTYVPNGFDDKLQDEKVKPFEQKENLIITVSRIGSVPKNHELMLEAIQELNLGDWKIWFVGPVEEGFVASDKVLLYGNVPDKKALWDIYNKSKVFLLSSDKEGFPNVFPEALNYGNYIITTAVSSTKDIVRDDSIGQIVPIGDAIAFREALKKVVDGEINLEKNFEHIIEHGKKFTWSNAVEPIVKLIDEKINRNSR